MSEVKVFTFLRHRLGASQDELCRYLREDLTPALRRTDAGSPMTAAICNPVLEMNYRFVAGANADGHDWSVIMEFYFPDAASATRAVEEAIAPMLEADGERFAEATSVVVNEFLLYDTLKAPDPIKVYGFYRISGSMTRQQSHDHLANGHARTGLDLKANLIIRKSFQNHTLHDFHNPQARYDYDGGSTLYFDSLDDAAKIYRNPELMAASAPSERAMGAEPGDTVHISAREEVLFDTRS